MWLPLQGAPRHAKRIYQCCGADERHASDMAANLWANMHGPSAVRTLAEAFAGQNSMQPSAVQATAAAEQPLAAIVPGPVRKAKPRPAASGHTTALVSQAKQAGAGPSACSLAPRLWSQSRGKLFLGYTATARQRGHSYQIYIAREVRDLCLVSSRICRAMPGAELRTAGHGMQGGKLVDSTEYLFEQEAADAAAQIWAKFKGAGAMLSQSEADAKQVRSN